MMMKPVRYAIGNQPQWVQPRITQNQFELRVGDDLFAVLVFPKMFGSLANAQAADGQWTFKRVGFFSPRVTVRKEGTDTDLAEFRPRWTGSEGTVQFTGGASFTWKQANFWATEYAVLDSSGETLILFRQGIPDAHLSDLFKVQASVEIRPGAQDLQELTLLVLLGWYLMILKQQDDTSATAATAAVG
jgi:hypothetical protein